MSKNELDKDIQMKSNPKLYHIDKYLPMWIIDCALIAQRNTKNFVISEHLWEQINNKKRSHNIDKDKLLMILSTLKRVPIIPFEVETNYTYNHFDITKYVVRAYYDEQRDISIVIRGHKVITAWLNDNNDNHPTIDLSKYEGEE